MTFVGTTSGCKIKAHPKCHGHVWDIKYYDIVMHDVQLPINLDQYLPRQTFLLARLSESTDFFGAGTTASTRRR